MSLDLGSAYGRILLDAADALDQTGKVGKALGGLAGPAAAMGGALVAAGAAAGGALLALGVSSVGVARDFESAMAVMSTAVDPVSVGAQTTAEAMDILGDASLAVGGDTALIGVSASSAAEAMTGLYKAGLSTGEIFGDLQGYLSGTAELSGALRASIDLAAASELDMVQASDLAAVTLATFGGHLETEAERAEFINGALNNFVQTADASQASVTDLAAALGTIGPTAASFGFSLEDVNVALGILSNRGITGSEAGTALKSMMTNMMRDTPAVTGALKELGIELYNVDGTMKPLPDIIGQFDSALNGTREVMVTVGGRTEEQNRQLELAMNAYDQATEAIYKHEAGLKVLSDEGLAKAQAQQAAANGEIERLQSIVGDTTVSLQDMTQEQRNQYIQTIAGTYGMNALNSLLAEGAIGWEEMEAAVGDAATMQETAAARTNTLAGAQEALGGVWEAFQIKVGTALIPALTALADIGASLLEKYGPTLQAAFEAFGSGISRIIEVLTTGNLGELFTVFEDGSSVLGRIFESFGMGEEKANALAAGISAVVLKVQEALAPVMAAVTSFVSWKDVLAALGIALAAVILPAIASLIAAVAPIVLIFAGITAAVALLRNAWENNWGGIQEKTAAVIEFVRGIIEAGLAAIRAFWDEHGAAIQAAAEAAWGAIQAAIELVVGVVRDIVESTLKAIRAFWDEHGEAITKVAQDAWEIISTAIDDALEIIKDVFDAFRKLFEGDWEGFTDGIQEVWEDIWQAIANFLEGLWDMVSPWLEQFWESIKEWFKPEKWIDLGKNIIQGIVKGINAVGMDILNVLGDWVQAAINWAKSLLGISSPSQVFFEIGENIAAGLIAGIRANITDAAAALEALFEAMGNVSGLAGGFGNQFLRRVLDPLRRGVEASQGSIDEMTAALERMATQLGYEEGFLSRPDAILELMRRANYQYATPAERATAQTMLAFLRERNRLQVQHIQLQRDLAEQEERLALLQEKQAQNDFLQQQLELIKFVRDNNLSADILNGITWGIGADAGALMDAMRKALTQMIAEAQKTLGIASPSRVFREIGTQVNRGLLAGLADNRAVLLATRGMMDEIAAQAAAASFPALAAGGRSANLYGGQHFYFQQPGGSILDDVQRLLAP